MHLDIFVCPHCSSPLRASGSRPGDPDRLVCTSCRLEYPVVDGMPVLLVAGGAVDPSAAAFAEQWALQAGGSYEKDTIYGETAEQELQSFLDRFGITAPAQLAGKRLLDIGCGSGRLTRNLALYAPQALVVGGERSDSAHLAQRRCRDAGNAQVAQLDLHRPPFAPASFDLVYADGVLPHVPDPEVGLASLDRLVRPGGALFVWIYPRRFSPYRLLRDLLGRPDRLPTALQRTLEYVFGVPLWAAFKLQEPLGGPRRRSLREVIFQLHDNFAPEYQHRRTAAQMVASFTRLGYTSVRALDPPVGVVGTKSGAPADALPRRW